MPCLLRSQDANRHRHWTLLLPTQPRPSSVPTCARVLCLREFAWGRGPHSAIPFLSLGGVGRCGCCSFGVCVGVGVLGFKSQPTSHLQLGHLYLVANANAAGNWQLAIGYWQFAFAIGAKKVYVWLGQPPPPPLSHTNMPHTQTQLKLPSTITIHHQPPESPATSVIVVAV
jgi:hypothetical protein